MSARKPIVIDLTGDDSPVKNSSSSGSGRKKTPRNEAVDVDVDADVDASEFDMQNAAKTSALKNVMRYLSFEKLIISRAVWEGNEPRLVDLPGNLVFPMRAVLMRDQVEHLFSHQIQARDAALLQRKSVVLNTPTASGKTLSVLLPTLEILLRERNATALFLFPLKALAIDQGKKLRKLLQYIEQEGGRRLAVTELFGETKVAAVFGDHAPQTDILLMTPDKLHYSMSHLGRFGNFAQFFKRLRIIVMDEAHSYSKLLGTHVSLLLRRVRNWMDVCGRPGLSTQLQYFILSATIANPEDLACELTGCPRGTFALITEAGNRVYPRHFVATRHKTVPVSRGLLDGMDDDNDEERRVGFFSDVLYGIISRLHASMKVLVFLPDVASVTRVTKDLQDLKKKPEGEEICARAFYASMGDAARKDTMTQFDVGKVQVLISTSALEAGVDFHNADCVICETFPGANSFLQRVGRAGRRSPGCCFLILADDKSIVDNWYCAHPEELKNIERQSVTLPNETATLAELHLRCALMESNGVLNPDLFSRSGSFSVLSRMLDEGKLTQTSNGMLSMLDRPQFVNAWRDVGSIRGSPMDESVDVRVVSHRNNLVENISSRYQVLWRCVPGGHFHSVSTESGASKYAGTVNSYVVLSVDLPRGGRGTCEVRYTEKDELNPRLAPVLESRVAKSAPMLRRNVQLCFPNAEACILTLEYGVAERQDCVVGVRTPDHGITKLDRTFGCFTETLYVSFTLESTATMCISGGVQEIATQNDFIGFPGLVQAPEKEKPPSICRTFLHTMCHAILKVLRLVIHSEESDVVESGTGDPLTYCLSDLEKFGNGTSLAIFNKFEVLFREARTLVSLCAKCRVQPDGKKDKKLKLEKSPSNFTARRGARGQLEECVVCICKLRCPMYNSDLDREVFLRCYDAVPVEESQPVPIVENAIACQICSAASLTKICRPCYMAMAQ